MWERYYSYFREFLIFSYPSLLWYIKILSHVMYSQRNITICCITITNVFHPLYAKSAYTYLKPLYSNYDKFHRSFHL